MLEEKETKSEQIAAKNTIKITKHHIRQHLVNTVEGYLRKTTWFVPQQIVDLILFFYAKPDIMNVKYESKTKSFFVCPIETTWDVIESRILESFGLSKWDSLIRFNYEHGTVNRYNWQSCGWLEEDTFECDVKLYTVEPWPTHRRRDLPPSPTTEQFDGALARYYRLMGSEYANQFSEYCEENGFDDLAEEMGGDHSDCMLVDFDEDIPFKLQPKFKIKAIFELLLKIYCNPDCDFQDFQEFDNEFIPLQINEEDFKIKKEDIEQVRAVYSEQLVTLFNGEMKDNQCILTILAISEKRKVPYFSYLIDMFTRDRIRADIMHDRNLQTSDWVAINRHCLDLKNSISTEATDLVQHALTFYLLRIMPKLMLSATTHIMDDLETTAKYISTQIDFVHSLAQKGNKTCPFQLDALIGYNNVKELELIFMDDHVDQDDDEVDEVDDEVDDDSNDQNDGKYDDFTDIFGDVKNKLNCEGLLHEIGVIHNETNDYEMCYQKFKQKQIKKKYNEQEFEEYPRNHRFCSFIDRRKPNKHNNNGTIDEDEIIFFEPPYNCNTIPNDARPLWYFDSSKTSIIPSIGYCKNQKTKQDLMNNYRYNIGSGNGAKGALVLISFHVLSVNEIRAYLYLNGQFARFFPSDTIDILARYFHPNEKNKRFIKSQVAKDLIARMKPKLRDLKFEAFYNAFGYPCEH